MGLGVLYYLNEKNFPADAGPATIGVLVNPRQKSLQFTYQRLYEA